MDSIKPFYGTGRRKTASARVFIKLNKIGQTNIVVNHKKADEYFSAPDASDYICQPLKALELENKFDIYATVRGGGTTGQFGAIRLGLAKALVAFEKSGATKPTESSFTSLSGDGISNDNSLEKQLSWYRRLRQAGKLTTTDARQVERKKYGLHKARKKAPHRKR